MTLLARTDRSVVGNWWWTIDRWSLAGVLLLLALGTVLVMAASAGVARRYDYDGFHFAARQLFFLLPALAVLIGVSMLGAGSILRLAVAGLAVSLLLMALAVLIGPEIKGATRWLRIAGVSLQPSEFAKPCFIVVTAWLLAARNPREGGLVGPDALLLFAGLMGLLVLQPDYGMAAVVGCVWVAQLFLAGLSFTWLVALFGIAVAGSLMAYRLAPHVAARIDAYLDPASGDRYQIETALEAFANGGLWGRGPGEGMVKRLLPDAHSDFIFAVAAEEFGAVACLLLILLFAFVALRGFQRAALSRDRFVVLAAGGLLVQFALQAAINIGVNLDLLPTKGMTLPFVSYGGSSLLALTVGMGMVLALTRRRTEYAP